MKINEIQIGMKCWCYVSGARTKVEVIERIEPNGGYSKRTNFRVRRCDNGKVLSPRDPSALHALPHAPAEILHEAFTYYLDCHGSLWGLLPAGEDVEGEHAFRYEDEDFVSEVLKSSLPATPGSILRAQ